MRTLPARVGAAPFFNQRSEDLSEVQEPILGSAEDGRQNLSAYATHILGYTIDLQVS